MAAVRVNVNVNVNQSVAQPEADITVYGTKDRVVGRTCTRMNMAGTWRS